MKSDKFTSLAEYRASLKKTKPASKPSKRRVNAEALGFQAAAAAVTKALAKVKKK